MTSNPLALPPAAAAQPAAAFAARWSARWDVFRRYAPPPWWGPGLAVDEETRRRYELYLPLKDYARDLGGLLRWVLPSAEWLPREVVQPTRRSLPDLWGELPPPLAGQLVPPPAQWLALACALAAPARHGTRAGRYPGQTAFLRQWVSERAAPVNALDAACGTGQGTYELALALDAAPGAQVTGFTLEPLEAWMARERRLPHVQLATGADALRAPWTFPPRAQHVRVEFAAGDLCAYAPPRPCDLVVCNGLIGGPMLDTDAAYLQLWERLGEWLAPDGVLLAAQHFHAGRQPAVARFAELRPAGFVLSYDADGGLIFRRET